MQKDLSDTEITELKNSLSRIEIEKRRFEDEKNRLLNELIETRNSKTYKLARMFTSIPRKLRGYKYKYGELPDYQTLYPYMISVVVAVYNTGDYLREMIDSILAQKQDILATFLRKSPDAQFKNYVFDNIYEILLIDDASDDESGAICDEYASKYPWIKFLHKEHGGVSKARNEGIRLAQGKYITFPDSDDILDPDVFEKCFLFYESHQDKISMVTYPLEFFEAQTGDHWTSYRFDGGTRILDMIEEWDKPQYFTAATFFRTEELKDKLSFDTGLINGEDLKLANDVLFNEKHCIGLVSDCRYHYRRRTGENNSAVQQSKETKSYYTDYIRDCLGYLIRRSEDVYGSVPKYIEYTVMGQLQWRLRSDSDGTIAKRVMGDHGLEEYRDAIKGLLKKIGVDVIISQKCLFREHFFYSCLIHTGGKYEVSYDEEEQNLIYYFDGLKATDAGSCYIRLEFMRIEKGHLFLEGKIADLEPDIETWADVSGDEYRFEITPNTDLNVKILGEDALFVHIFSVEIPLSKINDFADITFYSSAHEYKIVRKTISVGKFMPLSRQFSKSYYAQENYVVRLQENSLIIWNRDSVAWNIDFETEYQEQIAKYASGSMDDLKYALDIRRLALDRRMWRGSVRKGIWLISDRYSNADDNGEALFRYLCEHPVDGVDVYFVIDKDSEDFVRLSEIGNVVAQDSMEHHMLHMLADCIISSQADEYIWDPFWRKGMSREIFKDFYCRQHFVFLQHGVIKDDLSRWLNRFNKNISGFVVSAEAEEKSILECDYYYDSNKVWLTGLPRYDHLYHNEQKEILIMPTWRKWLMKGYDAASSDKDAVHVREDIEETEFGKFYSELLTNKELMDVCDEYGYRISFMPHTSMRECLGHIEMDERVRKCYFDRKYRDAFAEANLLVTDYSSTAMDFAYLEKPVIYAQFDAARFFSGEHNYDKGYFDYERDGFGEVVNSLDETVRMIISYIETGCEMKQKYKERVQSFFCYHDRNNCERVCEKIRELMACSITN